MTADERDESQPGDDSVFGRQSDDAAVDAMLRRHFDTELNGQLGRSATFFAEQLLREQREQPAPVATPAAPHRDQPSRGANRWAILRPWAWTVAAGSLAAAAAVVAVTISTRRVTPHTPGRSVKPPVQLASDDTPDPIERTVFYRTVDDGTVFLDDETPARQLRRQQVEQVTWLDRRTGRTSVTEMVPKEDVMVVAYNKH